MDIFEITKTFPQEEKFSLTDQIRRSSRSVPANISEAWKKRLYPKMFVNKIIDAAGEAGETRYGWTLPGIRRIYPLKNIESYQTVMMK